MLDGGITRDLWNVLVDYTTTFRVERAKLTA